jgi:hypothetical protein
MTASKEEISMRPGLRPLAGATLVVLFVAGGLAADGQSGWAPGRFLE